MYICTYIHPWVLFICKISGMGFLILLFSPSLIHRRVYLYMYVCLCVYSRFPTTHTGTVHTNTLSTFAKKQLFRISSDAPFRSGSPIRKFWRCVSAANKILFGQRFHILYVRVHIDSYVHTYLWKCVAVCCCLLVCLLSQLNDGR